ncbi:hypothetical protein K438DRAFT_1960807 [Mycena galopus ATCC 62051]|nr:hypothetical protein K438DRAFT_1960807 [Mycena galopus ATCC 62051]
MSVPATSLGAFPSWTIPSSHRRTLPANSLPIETMFFSPKALLGFASLVGLIVPGVVSAPSPVAETGLTVAAREIVDVEARDAVDGPAIYARGGDPFKLEITVVLDACLDVQNACKAVPDPYQASILAALSDFFAFLFAKISLSNPGSCCLGAILSGLYTSTLVNFLTTLIGCTISDVIAALTSGGVAALWLLCGGLPTGLNAAETAFCTALGLLYTALANALGAGCASALISAILVAINTLLAAIIALVTAVSTCSVCGLTGLLIFLINTLVATLVATLGLI